MQSSVFRKGHPELRNVLIFNNGFYKWGAANVFLACLSEKTRTAAAVTASQLSLRRASATKSL
jgi:hypothetical protein